jgi:uncharacterized protein YndB with AHSA1/START domain
MARSGLAGSTSTRRVWMAEAEKTRAPLIFQARVKAAPDVVFDAFFGTPGRWLCREARVDQQVGGRLRLCWPDGCCEGRFLQYMPAATARFSWHMEGDPLPETMVVVSFAPASPGETALEVEHYGFGVGPQWDAAYLGAVRAWAAYLKNLRSVLEAGLDLREADE